MPSTLEEFLEAPEGASNVLAHARLLLRLAHLYHEIAPPHLSQASTIANYKSGLIVIHAANAAVATKIRHLSNTLAEGFSKKGIECNDVQVKVQAWEIPIQSYGSTKKVLNTQSRQALENLRDSLPDSELRCAVETLLQRSAKAE